MSDDYRDASAGCVGESCQTVFHRGFAFCESGQSTCNMAKLLEAEPSGFHDATLIEATNKINQILEAIPADSQGRTLSFLHTKWGEMLGWVDHKTMAPADGIRPDADDATMAKALGLKGDYAAGAGAGSY